MSELIDFDRIDDQGVQHLRESLDLRPEELEREELQGGVRAAIDVEASGGELEGEYLVDGTLDFTSQLVCGRCLEPFPFANRSSFTVRYLPRPEGSDPEEETELEGEELDVEYYDGRTVSLRELAGEQVQLAIPMKTLCTEDCHGLCPVCGANRNRTSCSCTTEAPDPRWEGLQKIREQLEDRNSKS